MIRLVCIDVDGTIVGTGGVVHGAVWRAVDEARERGLRLAICSGRPGFGLAREYATRLDPTGWHSFQNGASVMHLPSGGSRSHALPAALLASLVARSRADDLLLELYSDLSYAVEQDSPLSRAHARLMGVPFHVRAFEAIEGTVVRAQWIFEDDRPLPLEAHEATQLDVSPSTSPAMPGITFVSLTPAGIDKATAVRTIAAQYSLALDEVMYVGDGRNDVTAMRAAGMAVAMANAEPEALAVADRVVGHVDDGGLADALRLAMQEGDDH